MLQTLPTNDHRLVFQQEPYKKNLCLNKKNLENLQKKRQKKKKTWKWDKKYFKKERATGLGRRRREERGNENQTRSLIFKT